MDRYFDLHPKACWTRAGKGEKNYTAWLARNTTPIYMQKHYAEAPASIEYPKRRILLEFADARGYFTNHVAWMIALALTEGVDSIGLYGINYSTESEYVRQRGSAEYWLGRASGAGVRVVLPEQCSLLKEPALLYGYESHDEQTGLIKDDYKRKKWEGAATIRPLEPGETPRRAEPPEHVRALIEQETKDCPRPEWSLGPVGEAIE